MTARQRAAERSVGRREAMVANANPYPDNLQPHRSFMFQLNASAFGSHEIPGITLFFTGKTNVTNRFESGCNYQET